MKSKKVHGAGGGGGGGSSSSSAPAAPRSAIVAADSLTSRQYARVLDLVSEGEIEGLVNGDQSVYLDDTPLQNSDGTYNFSGYTVDERSGAVAQSYIEGFPATENAYSVSVEVPNGVPVVRAVSNQNIDAVRINLAVPQLYSQDPSSGDVGGASVTLTIEVQPLGGNYELATSDTISGKASSRYNRNYRVDLPGDGPWNIRVTKTSPESDNNTKRDLYWDTTTEIIDVRLSHPNSALMGLTIDSSQFSNIPTRAYDLKGIRVKVPTNYDPIARTYSGIWDGSFKVAWTDNPAWCYYDLQTNPRYGLGEFVPESQVDKANLYTIAKYCDELVPDGFGGMEPRFSCNMYLQTREDAFKVLSDMVGLFAGMLFWASGGLSCTQDSPDDPIYQFTNANVIEGTFTYQGSSRNVRHTTALISYNDPTDRYLRKVEYVEDEEGIQKYGIRQYESVAIGCASRGQAHRLGKRVLLTERFLTETVTFKTGLEACVPYPGAVIQVMDNDRAGARLGGRVKSATLSEVTLDSPVELEEGETYLLTIIKPDGILEQRGIVTQAGSVQVISTTTPFSESPGSQSVWVLSSTNVDAQMFKVIGIKETEDLVFEITALAYNPSKYDAIDLNLTFDPLTVSLIPDQLGTAIPPTPGNLTLGTATYTDTSGNVGVEVLVGWSGGSPSFEFAWREDEGNWHTDTTNLNGATIRPARIGSEYDITVFAQNRFGWRSALPATGTIAVTEDALPPRTVLASLLANPDFLGVSIAVTVSSPLRRKDTIEIVESLTNNRASAYGLCVMHQPLSPFARAGMVAAETRYYWGRVVNAAGIPGEWYPASAVGGIAGSPSTDKSWMLDRIIGEIGLPHLAEELASPIGLIPSIVTGLGSKASTTYVDDSSAAAVATSALSTATAVNSAMATEVSNRNAAIAVTQAKVDTLLNSAAYSETTAYAAGQTVTYSGVLYSAKSSTTGNLPTDTAYWKSVGTYTSIADALADSVAKISQINFIDAASTSPVAQQLVALQGTVSTNNTNVTSNLSNNYYTKTSTDSAIASAGTALKASIQIGGTNLLLRSAQLDNWTSVGGNMTVSGGVASSVSNGAENYVAYGFPNGVAGREYTASVEVKSSGLNNGIVFPVYYDGNWQHYQVMLVNSAEYTRISFTFTTTAPGLVQVALDNFQNTTGTVSYRLPKLEVGNKATDWSPAPADNDAAITAAVLTETNARVTAVESVADRATILEAAVNDPTTGLGTKASTSYVDTAKSDAISAAATALSLLSTTVSTNATTAHSENATEASTRASADGALSSRIDTVSATASKGVNLSDTSWWSVGCANAWVDNGHPAETEFVLATTPSGHDDVVCQMVAGAGGSTVGADDGGWNSAPLSAPVDRTKTYRFVVPCRKLNEIGGSNWWGTANVCTLNTDTQPGNPYFVAHHTLQEIGVWYYFVGYVFPAGSTGRTHDGSGVFNAKTGEHLVPGNNWCWPSTDVGGYHRAYQYYAAAGQVSQFGRPMVHVIDGSEPPLSEILSTVNAAVTVESAARASAVSALSSRTTALETAVNDPSTGLSTKASVNYVDTAKSDAISAAASASSTLISTAGTTAVWTGVTSKPSNVAALSGSENINNAQIVIGGRNLVPGSSDGYGWTGHSYHEGSETRLSTSATGETAHIWSEAFWVKGSTEVTLSFETMQTGVINSIDGYLLGSNYGATGAIIGFGTLPMSSSWVKQTLTFTTSPGFNTEAVKLRFDHNGGDGSLATICVRNVKLEYGNKATDWTPAPEDVSRQAQAKANAAAATVQQLSLINHADIEIVGNTAKKVSGGDGWHSGFYSKDSYTGGAYVSFVPATLHQYMVGLNTDPLANASYASLDYAFFMIEDGRLYGYESGASVGELGTYTTSDVLAIAYDGINVKYFKNGTVLRTVPVTITAPLFLDSSFNNTNSKVTNIQFGPVANLATLTPSINTAATTASWGGVTGANKPADNATANQSDAVTNSAIGTAATTANWSGVSGNKPIQYSVLSAGYTAPSPRAGGVYNLDTGVVYRIYWTVVTRFNSSTGAYIDQGTFNLYGGGSSASAAMADFLNGSTSSHIIVVATYDQPGEYAARTQSGLAAAMYRCGASVGVWGYNDWGAGRGYILIGVPGAGEGNSYELLSATPAPSWCEATFTIQNGRVNVSGAGSNPKTVWGSVESRPANIAALNGDEGINNALVQQLSLVNSSGMTISGNTATKTSGADMTWDSSAISRDSYAGGAFMSFVPANTGWYMVGLNVDPTPNNHCNTIDYAWYCVGDGGLTIYESGVNKDAATGSYIPGSTVLAITYDGINVKYFKDGVNVRTVAATIAFPLFFDSSFCGLGNKITNIQFGPVASLATLVPSIAAAQTTANTAASSASAVADRASTLETAVNHATTGLGTKASTSYVDTAKSDAISAGASAVATIQSSLTGGGVNLIPNAGFDFNIDGWSVGWSQYGEPCDLTRNLAGSYWQANGISNIGLHRGGTTTGIQDVNSDTIVAEPNARYCYSAYLAAHRTTAEIYVYFLDSSGASISAIEYGEFAPPSGGGNLSSWSRPYLFFTTPSNCAMVRLHIRGWGGSDSYLWMCRPMLERATPSQNVPSPWSPSVGGLVNSIATAQTTANTAASDAAAAASTANTLQARLNTGDFATVQTNASTAVTKTGQIEAKWGVKAQTMADGVVAAAGIELISGASGQTAFAVLADKFLIYKPDGTGTPVPVLALGTVNGSTALGLNGSLVVDGSIYGRSLNVDSLVTKLADVSTAYIGSANIENAAVKTANIEDAAVKTANIDDLAVNTLKIANGAVTSFTQISVGQGSPRTYVNLEFIPYGWSFLICATNGSLLADNAYLLFDNGLRGTEDSNLGGGPRAWSSSYTGARTMTSVTVDGGFGSGFNVVLNITYWKK